MLEILEIRWKSQFNFEKKNFQRLKKIWNFIELLEFSLNFHTQLTCLILAVSVHKIDDILPYSAITQDIYSHFVWSMGGLHE